MTPQGLRLAASLLLIASAGCTGETPQSTASEGDASSTGAGSDSMSSTSAASASASASASATSGSGSGEGTSSGGDTSGGETTGAAPACGDGTPAIGELCYQPPVSANLPAQPLFLAAGDLNDDGRDDLVVGTITGQRLLFQVEAGSGSILPAGTIDAPGWRIGAVAIGDVDGDGVNEVLASVNTNYETKIEIHTRLGDTYDLLTTIPLDAPLIDLALADLNGDGDVDLITNDWSGGLLLVFKGDGDGGFAPWQEVAVGQRPRGFEIADLDGDGALEVVVAPESCQGAWLSPESSCDPSASAVVRGLEAEAPEVAVVPAGPYYNNRIVLADLDQDATLDLLALTSDCYVAGVDPYCNSPGAFALQIGDGDGGFGVASLAMLPRGPNDGLARDLDGDGVPELALIHQGGPYGDDPGGRLSLFPLPGDGGLGEPVVVEVGVGLQSMASLDVNADGVPDFAIADSGANKLHIVLSDP
ncbi:MAG: VCBS repeat-containing protein [Myxococcales bacterium]|nr:VCBS repeat-containing protein [Myxococcales bacterium]